MVNSPGAGSCYQQQGRSGPLLPLSVFLSLQRDERCPRDEASVQALTKEIRLDTQRGRKSG